MVLGGIASAGYMKSVKVKEQFNLGIKFLKEGKYEEAIIAFEKVIKIDPKNLEARVNMAKACIQVNKLELAEKMLKEAISIDSKNAESYLLLGRLYVDTGRIEEAIALQDNGFSETNNNEIKNFKEELSAILQKSKENYESAIKQMGEKRYLEAMDMFGRVDKRDEKRYLDSQNKILECKRLYINDNLKMAEESFKNNKFDEANSILNNIAKIDENNSEMLKLKDDINKSKTLSFTKLENMQKVDIGKITFHEDIRDIWRFDNIALPGFAYNEIIDHYLRNFGVIESTALDDMNSGSDLIHSQIMRISAPYWENNQGKYTDHYCCPSFVSKNIAYYHAKELPNGVIAICDKCKEIVGDIHDGKKADKNINCDKKDDECTGIVVETDFWYGNTGDGEYGNEKYRGKVYCYFDKVSHKLTYADLRPLENLPELPTKSGL